MFRNVRSTQISRCSSWGTEVKLFLSLWKKLKDYNEETQVIANPFANRSHPSRPKPSPFAKRPKATPIKRSNSVTRHNIEKLSKPRKINVGYHPKFMQQNWFAVKAKEVEAVEQAPHIYPTSCNISHIQPATASAAPSQPTETLPTQSQKSPRYCDICNSHWKTMSN